MLLHNKMLQEDAAPFSFDTCFSMDMKPYLKPVEFAPNEIILHTNEMPEHLLLLRRGLAKIYISQPNGRLSLTRFVHAPDFIGALELVGAQQTAEETRAVSTCRCLALPLTECRSRLLGDTIFLRCLWAARTLRTARPTHAIKPIRWKTALQHSYCLQSTTTSIHSAIWRLQNILALPIAICSTSLPTLQPRVSSLRPRMAMPLRMKQLCSSWLRYKNTSL